MSTGSAGPPGYSSGAGGTAQQAADRAQDKVQELSDQAQQQAQQAASQARSRLRQEIDGRSSQAAEQINSQAADLRAVSESLREQGKEGPASAADRLAGYAEKVGDYLRERDSTALLSDVEDLGRRQPWAIAAGGAALGFAASRFLKASSSQRYSSRGSGGSAPASGGATGYASPAPPVPVPPRPAPPVPPAPAPAGGPVVGPPPAPPLRTGV